MNDTSFRQGLSVEVAADHGERTFRLLVETFGVTLGLTLLAMLAQRANMTTLVWLLAVPRGLWILRHYAVGHEAAHAKLLPAKPRANNFWGQLALLSLLTPLPVFRKIHQFHHGHNRRDEHTSALDVVCVKRNDVLRRTYAWARWLFLAFGGGWFWHGLLSILLFLLLPVRVAVKLSPAFEGWSMRDRAWSVFVFLVAIGVHAVCWFTFGAAWWLAVFGAPLLVFSWVYSAQLYVYHYDTSIGPNVAGNARCLGGPVVGWWILNLNEHATHHKRPAIVWYRLRDATRTSAIVEQQPRRSLVWGVLNQLQGPRLFVTADKPSGNQT